MNDRDHPGRVEDFTDAFLVSFGVLLFIMLWTVNIVLGFIWALTSAYGCDKLVSRINRRR